MRIASDHREMERGGRLSRALCFWVIGCMCMYGARVARARLPKWPAGGNSRTAKACGFGGIPRMRCGSNEAAELVSAAGAGVDGVVFCSAPCDCGRVRLSHARRLRWRGASVDNRELHAPGRSAVSGDSMAVAVDCRIIDRHLRGTGISFGAVHFARVQAEEFVSATGAAAILDELSGADLCVAVYPARYRPDQYRSFGAAHYQKPAAAAL